MVLRVTARLAGREDREDLAQDAFLRAFHRLGELRDPEQFRPWLLRIAHHAALDHLDRRRRRPTVQPSDDEDPEGAPAHERTPARLVEERERRTRLAGKLALLRPEHRLVLVLRDLEGLSYDEVAAVTGMPLGSVKGRLHRARAELIQALRDNAYDWELPDDRP